MRAAICFCISLCTARRGRADLLTLVVLSVLSLNSLRAPTATAQQPATPLAPAGITFFTPARPAQLALRSPPSATVLVACSCGIPLLSAGISISRQLPKAMTFKPSHRGRFTGSWCNRRRFFHRGSPHRALYSSCPAGTMSPTFDRALSDPRHSSKALSGPGMAPHKSGLLRDPANPSASDLQSLTELRAYWVNESSGPVASSVSAAPPALPGVATTSSAPGITATASAAVAATASPVASRTGCYPFTGVQPVLSEVEDAVQRGASGSLHLDPSLELPAEKTGPDGSSSLQPAYIPPTILRSISWIETSWHQATWETQRGQSGPTLVSGGCAYGLMQIASGMSIDSTPTATQKLIGGDFHANLQAGAQLLAKNWNRDSSVLPYLGRHDPHVLEDWYFAVWAYHCFGDSCSTYGAHDNPDDPSLPWPRPSYNSQQQLSGSTSYTYSDYPYQELIFGLANNPPLVDGHVLWQPITCCCRRTGLSDFLSRTALPNRLPILRVEQVLQSLRLRPPLQQRLGLFPPAPHRLSPQPLRLWLEAADNKKEPLVVRRLLSKRNVFPLGDTGSNTLEVTVDDRHRALFSESEVRGYLPKQRQIIVPAGENFLRPSTAGRVPMPADQRVQDLDVRIRGHLLHSDQLGIKLLRKLAALVEHIGDAVRHAGSEVAACLPQDDDDALSHVLAAVIANALDYRFGAAVTYCEALARPAGGEKHAAGRAIEDRVADDSVVVAGKRRVLRRPHNHLTAAHPLAHIVVGLAPEL